MAHWEPQAEGLNQIITLLKQSQSTDNQIQRNVQLVSVSSIFSPRRDHLDLGQQCKIFLFLFRNSKNSTSTQILTTISSTS